MSEPDPAAAYLEEVRERLVARFRWPATSPPAMHASIKAAGDVLPLLRMAEAVLALADKLSAQGVPSSALEEDRMWVRQECAGMFREAITAALLGKEDDDG